jgi:hypothetical protein
MCYPFISLLFFSQFFLEGAQLEIGWDIFFEEYGAQCRKRVDHISHALSVFSFEEKSEHATEARQEVYLSLRTIGLCLMVSKCWHEKLAFLQPMLHYCLGILVDKKMELLCEKLNFMSEWSWRDMRLLKPLSNEFENDFFPLKVAMHVLFNRIPDASFYIHSKRRNIIFGIWMWINIWKTKELSNSIFYDKSVENHLTKIMSYALNVDDKEYRQERGNYHKGNNPLYEPIVLGGFLFLIYAFYSRPWFFFVFLTCGAIIKYCFDRRFPWKAVERNSSHFCYFSKSENYNGTLHQRVFDESWEMLYPERKFLIKSLNGNKRIFKGYEEKVTKYVPFDFLCLAFFNALHGHPLYSGVAYNEADIREYAQKMFLYGFHLECEMESFFTVWSRMIKYWCGSSVYEDVQRSKEKEILR